jgi:hypothetical protein
VITAGRLFFFGRHPLDMTFEQWTAVVGLSLLILPLYLRVFLVNRNGTKRLTNATEELEGEMRRLSVDTIARLEVHLKGHTQALERIQSTFVNLAQNQALILQRLDDMDRRRH